MTTALLSDASRNRSAFIAHNFSELDYYTKLAIVSSLLSSVLFFNGSSFLHGRIFRGVGFEQGRVAFASADPLISGVISLIFFFSFGIGRCFFFGQATY